MFSKMAMKAYMVDMMQILLALLKKTKYFCHFCYFLPQKIRFTFRHSNTRETYFQLTAFGKI